MYFVAKPNEEAKAFIQAAGLIDETQCRAVGTLVIDLKNYNIWDKMKAIYPMVGQAGVSSSFQFNLKNPTLFKGTFSGSWIFSSTGATPDGTSAYMNTGLNASTQFSSLDSNHLSFYSRTNSTGGGAFPSELGSIALAGPQDFELYCGRPTPTNSMVYIANNYDTNILSGSNGGNTLGFFNGSRTSSTSLKIYKNGASGGTITTSRSGNYNNCNIGLSALIQADGTPLSVTYSNKQCAFASIGDGLTDTDAANLYTAVQRFQTTLGRQV